MEALSYGFATVGSLLRPFPDLTGFPVVNPRLRWTFKYACEKANIPYGMNTPGGLKFHDIRTTVKTNMLRAGIDKALRDTVMGHSLKGMDTFYLKPIEKDIKQAMDRYTAWLDTEVVPAFVDYSVD